MNYILCWKSCKSSSWIIWISPTTVHGLCQSCVRPTVTNFANCSGDVSTVQERAIQFSTANFHRRTPSRSDRWLLIPFVLKCTVGTSSVTASVSTPRRHRGDSVLLLPWYLPVYVAGIVLWPSWCRIRFNVSGSCSRSTLWFIAINVNRLSRPFVILRVC